MFDRKGLYKQSTKLSEVRNAVNQLLTGAYLVAFLPDYFPRFYFSYSKDWTLRAPLPQPGSPARTESENIQFADLELYTPSSWWIGARKDFESALSRHPDTPLVSKELYLATFLATSLVGQRVAKATVSNKNELTISFEGHAVLTLATDEPDGCCEQWALRRFAHEPVLAEIAISEDGKPCAVMIDNPLARRAN